MFSILILLLCSAVLDELDIQETCPMGRTPIQTENAHPNLKCPTSYIRLSAWVLDRVL